MPRVNCEGLALIWGGVLFYNLPVPRVKKAVRRVFLTLGVCSHLSIRIGVISNIKKLFLGKEEAPNTEGIGVIDSL